MKVTGVLHMHSTHSYDGKLSLSELKAMLQKRGVSFCCMTEHTDEMTPEGAHAFLKECRALSDDSFVFVPGFEVPYKRAHVLHIGATEFVCQFADAAQLFAWRKVVPLVVLAHPVRNKFIVDETLLSVIDGVEVWNQQYEGKGAPRFRSLKLLKALQKQKHLIATGGLDFHRGEHYGTPQLSLETVALTEEGILKALQAGRYTFGTPQIVLSADGQFVIGGGFAARMKSVVSILIITLGKQVNKTLARLGLHLPRSLRRALRARV